MNNNHSDAAPEATMSNVIVNPQPTKLFAVHIRSGVPTLFAGDVLRSTKLYFFLANAEVTGWANRINRSDVDAVGFTHATVATTPLLAWEFFQKAQRRIEDNAREQALKAVFALQAAQLEVDAIRDKQAIQPLPPRDSSYREAQRYDRERKDYQYYLDNQAAHEAERRRQETK